MPQTKELQRRLRSVGNIKKITKAMELVAAAKMKRAISSAVDARSYVQASSRLVGRFFNSDQLTLLKQHQLLLTSQQPVNKVALVVIGSDRGLCGPLNANLLHQVREFIKQRQSSEPQLEFELFLVGKKLESLVNLGHKIVVDFLKADLLAKASNVEVLANMLINDFKHRLYDQVFLVSSKFINPVKQVSQTSQLLPLSVAMFQDTADLKEDFLCEPSPQTVLDFLLPRLIEALLRQAVLEADASEQSARMTAMHQASEAAAEMADELTLSFNKARQAVITAEIAEISSGASLLRDN